VAPTSQALAGTQASPAWQGTHSPAPSQIPVAGPLPASQVTVPAAAGVPPPQAGPALHAWTPVPAARQTLAGVQPAPLLQRTHAPAASQTWPAPQEAPAAASWPVSAQVGAPVEQEVSPRWQAVAGAQESPAWQGRQSPVPSQIPGTPPTKQVSDPAATGVAPPQEGPPLQDWIPLPVARQMLAGVQAVPSLQATHAPPASQTWAAPQVVPGLASWPVSEQVWAPVEQEVSPVWQALAGTQAFPARQGRQSPLPSQIPGVPAASQVSDPAGTGVPPPQEGPPLQDWRPLPMARQGLAGVQVVPSLQATQAPAAVQTWAAPQAVPGLASWPVSAQLWAPVEQEVSPRWQASAGTQAFPAWQGTQDPLPSQMPGAPAASQVTVPAATGVPPLQEGPAVHDSTPVPVPRQTLVGEQALASVQARQAPAASQTWAAPQAVPGSALGPGVQVPMPRLQATVPVRHGSVGMQAPPGVQPR